MPGKMMRRKPAYSAKVGTANKFSGREKFSGRKRVAKPSKPKTASRKRMYK